MRIRILYDIEMRYGDTILAGSVGNVIGDGVRFPKECVYGLPTGCDPTYDFNHIISYPHEILQ